MLAPNLDNAVRLAIFGRRNDAPAKASEPKEVKPLPKEVKPLPKAVKPLPKAVKPLPKASEAKASEPKAVHCAECACQVNAYVVHSNGKKYCSKCYNRGNCTVCRKPLTLFDARFRKDSGELYCAGCLSLRAGCAKA
jgi:hypothetical protein